MTMTVCGNEELSAASGVDSVFNAGSMGTNEYKKIASSKFTSFFSVKNSPQNKDKKDLCPIDSYKLYDSSGQEITSATVKPLAQMSPKYNEYIVQDLLIRLDKDAGVLKDQKFQLEAVSLGSKTAR